MIPEQWFGRKGACQDEWHRFGSKLVDSFAHGLRSWIAVSNRKLLGNPDAHRSFLHQSPITAKSHERQMFNATLTDDRSIIKSDHCHDVRFPTTVSIDKREASEAIMTERLINTNQ